jgi:hypothetical protein
VTTEDANSTTPRRRPTPPGEGERRAVRGLAAQYQVAARLIYDALITGQLDWIRVADPEAGRLDDIQIATPGRLDAYQVKWSSYEGRLLFNALVKPVGDNPAIIAQLAEGWSKLETLHPDRSVQVHFLSREQASTTDEVGEMPGAPGPRHFQAFLKHEYPNRNARASFDPSGAPETPFARLLAASELTAEQFRRFLPALHFELGYRLDDDREQDGGRRQADIDTIADLIFALVKRDDKRVQFDRSALVAALGWERRLDVRFRHEFPVDERTYRPITATVRELDGALAAHDRGYLALIGPPGSGKSTTLTQTLRYRPGFRFVRYYAFVRNDTAQGRGEAEAFLSDITVALRRAGFNGRAQNRLPQTLAELQATLGEQLSALSTDWLENSVKTVILVDGLDHIERELKPTHSLFSVLPLPDSVPPGVLFVLGTQKIGLAGLPVRIRTQVERAGRSLEIGRLSQQDVSLIALGRPHLAVLSPSSLLKLWRLSGGHPLALAYLLEQLSQADDLAAVETILDSATPFSADITENYRIYWDELKTDPEVRTLLGLVCRLRGGVELEVLKTLAPASALERFVGRAAHYFTKPATDRWTFFHNSFRQFLIVETAKDAFGRADDEADRVFHKILADHAAARPDTPFGWDRLFHLNAGGDDKGVLDLFTQSHFRRQFFAMRRSSEILEDIALCARAAAKAGDAVAVMRAVLIEHEVQERTEALKDADVDALVVSLAEREALAETIIRDGELRLSAQASLDLADKIYDDGDVFVARRLFDLAEPVDLLSGVRPVSDRSTAFLVQAWARAAWKFHPVDTVLSLIRQVRVVEKRRRRGEDWDDPEATKEAVDPAEFQNRLLRTLGVALIKAHQPTGAVEAALTAAATPSSSDELAQLEFERVRLGLTGRIDRTEALAAWRRMAGIWTAHAIDTDTGSPIVTTGLRLGASIQEVEPYSVKLGAFEPGEPDWGDKTIDAFWPVCEQAAVLTALSREPDPADAIPDTDRHRSRGAVLFNRMFVVIGAVRGAAIAKRHLPPLEVVRKLGPALSLFRRPWEETHQWSDWHAVRSRAAPYFELILHTADLHGSEALSAVLEALERDWIPKDGRASYWLADWRRAVALCAFELDGDRDRTLRWLAEIEGDLNSSDDLSERIEHRASQIRAWQKVGERKRAQAVLVEMIADSFAVYHSEDDQLDRWSDQAQQALSGLDATEVAKAISPLLGALPVLMSGHHSAGDDASKRLVAIAARCDPSWGAEVSRWLLDQHGVTRQAALRGLIQGALDRPGGAAAGPIAALAAARLIAPFETTTDRDFLKRLGRGSAETEDAESVLFA